MTFTPFQKFIERAANRHGIGTELKAAEICQQFRNLVPKIFSKHENPAQYIKPAHFKNGILTISTDSPGWSQEVIMRKEKIIKEMNARAGKEVIKKLQAQVKTSNN